MYFDSLRLYFDEIGVFIDLCSFFGIGLEIELPDIEVINKVYKFYEI